MLKSRALPIELATRAHQRSGHDAAAGMMPSALYTNMCSMTKRAEREEARRRRARGESLITIARDLGVARSSVSVWVRDIKQPTVVETRSPVEPADDGVL